MGLISAWSGLLMDLDTFNVGERLPTHKTTRVQEEERLMGEGELRT